MDEAPQSLLNKVIEKRNAEEFFGSTFEVHEDITASLRTLHQQAEYELQTTLGIGMKEAQKAAHYILGGIDGYAELACGLPPDQQEKDRLAQELAQLGQPEVVQRITKDVVERLYQQLQDIEEKKYGETNVF